MTELEKYPHLFAPRDAVPFDLNASVSLAGPSALVLLDSISPIGVGFEGIIRYIELSSSDFGTTASPDSYFQFQMAQKPIQYYSKITQPMVATTPVLIYLKNNQMFQIFSQNLTASPISLRYRLTGWYYKPVGAK